MYRFSRSVYRGVPPLGTVYTGPHEMRAHVLQSLAVKEYEMRDRLSVIAGRVLVICTLALGFLI